MADPRSARLTTPDTVSMGSCIVPVITLRLRFGVAIVGNDLLLHPIANSRMSVPILIQILKTAIANGKHVKAVGNGHSPSDIACSDDYQISLKKFNRVLNIDKNLYQVTVETGILLEDLNGILHKNNLALSKYVFKMWYTVSQDCHVTTSCVFHIYKYSFF